jgi:hypothetical protein
MREGVRRYDRHGRELDDQDEIVPDGGRLVVSPLNALDGVPLELQPALRATYGMEPAVSEAQAAYDRRIERVCNAWRQRPVPPSPFSSPRVGGGGDVPPLQPQAGVGLTVEEALQRRAHRLANAWRP